MPSGDDDEIAARCAALFGFGDPGFGDALPGVRLLVALFAATRFLGALLTAEFLAGRNVLE